MAEERTQRRLAAILAADVVGYSRLMEADEAGMLAILKARRRDVLGPLVAKHQGRIFKTTGDGVLVEFASAVNAVQCAVDLQQGMAAANSGQPDEQHIILRIGVNLGDVMVEGSDLYGDGVNVAARLEALADPGSVFVSQTVFSHVKGKAKLDFEDTGEHSLKNIAQPVRVYRVAAPEMEGGVLPLPDKPSIAVLPFTNMSGDPDQEYFSDGITEDIITELSRFREIMVIARNSSFQFRGKTVDVKEVGRKLGVHFVVEGSVRKIGNRARVTAQLIDAASGAHIWADRYDRTLEDVFEVQDEVVRKIAGTVPGHVGRLAIDRARRKPTSDLSAQDHLLRARQAMLETYDVSLGLEHLHKVIEIDPECAPAHALISWAYSIGVFNLGLDPDIAVVKAYKHSALAIAIDDSDPEVLAAAATSEILMGEHELADVHSRRACETNPNSMRAINTRGLILAYLGRFSEAMQYFQIAQRVDPIAKNQVSNEPLTDCLFMMGEYEKVLKIYRGWLNFPIHLKLSEAAICALLGRMDEAAAALEKFNNSQLPKPDPKIMIKFQLRMCARQEDRDRWLEGYRKAGLDV